MSPPDASGPSPTSWKEASVYQIYPASFKDTTGSGTGDLQGVIAEVDYLHELGVDIVWLSPIFASPQVDMGYDVSDYRTIDPQYGSIADVDELKDKLHARGMKLILDLVVNHTSDQHEWFREARSSVDNPYRDWYIWKKPAATEEGGGDQQPPNNWQSHFQGSAWQYEAATGEAYLHLFAREQPDLNWANPAVRAAVHDTMRFWLDRGIDGFRMDVINFISKDPAFPDSDRDVLPGCEFYAAGPRLHEYLRELGAVLQEYGAFSVGEMPCVNDTRAILQSVAADRGELNMIFHFELMDLDHGPAGKFSPRAWSLAELKTVVAKWQHAMYDHDGWNALYLENHDQPRSVSRFTSSDAAPALRAPAAKMLAVFLGGQAGTPFLYQGQELGMCNMPPDWGIAAYKDVDCLRHWAALEKGGGSGAVATAKATALKEYSKKARDHARTPMQWDATANAGFTTATTPWMPVHPNHTVVNAAAERADPDSPFHCWRRVLAARKQHKDVLVYGRFALVDAADMRVFAYARTSSAGVVVLVACNFTAETVRWPWPGSSLGGASPAEVLVSTVGRAAEGLVGTDNMVVLSAFEGLAVLLG